MGHHGANSRLSNGIMPDTRTLSACLQPQVLQVHGFPGFPTSSPDFSAYYLLTIILLPAGGVMQSVKGPGHRPHDQCCPRGPLRRPWCIGRTVRFGWDVMSNMSILYSNSYVCFYFGMNMLPRVYCYEIRTLSALNQNSVSNVWNSWELPGQIWSTFLRSLTEFQVRWVARGY